MQYTHAKLKRSMGHLSYLKRVYSDFLMTTLANAINSRKSGNSNANASTSLANLEVTERTEPIAETHEHCDLEHMYV